MAVVSSIPEPNAWTQICKDAASRRPPFDDADLESVDTELEDYDPSKHTPVFYGIMHQRCDADQDVLADVDPALGHPAAYGYALVERPPPCTPDPEPALPNYEKCSPREYLEAYIFPTLLPALEELLKRAKKERCFERKRTRFNALDFLTELLYQNNPMFPGRNMDGTYLDIDFVKEYLEKYPRPPLPLSLRWSEEEATLVIQSYWRGYLVRREPEVQELRRWQKTWREELEDVNSKVTDFWAHKMPSLVTSDSVDDVAANNVDCEPESTFSDDRPTKN